MARTSRIGKSRKTRGRKKVPKGKEQVQVSLSDERSEPMVDLADFSILCYGERKIGKTTLFSHFEDACFLMCEPGGKALSIYQNPVSSWVEFKQYIKLLRQDDQFQNVIVDTADRAYKMCFDFACQKMGIDHPQDENDYGKSWGQIKDEFAREVNALLSLGKGVAFISHAREEETKTRAGRAYSRMQPSMSNQAREVLESLVDIWVYYGYDGTHRVLTLRGDDYVSAGIRLEDRFLYTDGSPIENLNMGGSSEEAYDQFVSAFNNEVEAPRKEDERSSKKKRLKKKVRLRGR